MTIDKAEFEALLESKAREIRLVLGDWESIAVESSADDLERIHLAGERDIAVQHADRETRLLRDVENALARLRSGDYGECTECGDRISGKRLKAVPWASRCLNCQEKVDCQPAASVSLRILLQAA